MSDQRGRASNRIFFQAPARIRGSHGLIDAHIEDISATGIRLRLLRAALALEAERGIGAVAAAVQHRLGGAFTAALDPGREGLGVFKRLAVVRLSLPDAAIDEVDLGCLFDEPLTDREALLLGLDLPAETCKRVSVRRPASFAGPCGGEPTARRRLPAAEEGLLRAPGRPPPPAEHVPLRPLRAVVAGAAERVAVPLVCQTESFTEHTVLVRARGEMLPYRRARGRENAACAALEFTAQYGDRVNLEIVEGTRSVWRGPTQVCAVEVDPAHRRDLLLRLAFGRPLQAGEIASLRG